MLEKIVHLLTEAFHLKASDLHITVGVPPMMRINGELKEYGQEIVKPDDSKKMLYPLLTDQLIEKFEQDGEVDFSYGVRGVSRYRINAFMQRSCVSIAVRIIPSRIPTLEELNLPRVLQEVAQYPQGLVLVTGPTGSGKSTTLAAMIDYMNNTERKHVITLEDPIEYTHKHNKCIIDQREVGFDTRSFSNGLRASLRQDPDVILVGELRDLETIATALTAAETGHLVLGTLHTLSAPLTIDRLIDVFPPNQQTQVRIQLASALKAIISQRLFPSVDKNCRHAATEIMINNAATANLIRNEKVYQIHNVMQTSKEAGMHTLEMSIKNLLSQHLISRQVAQPYLQGKDI